MAITLLTNPADGTPNNVLSNYQANITAANANDTELYAACALMQTLTDAATIAWDTSLGASAKVTIAANRTMGLPTNLTAGKVYRLAVTQSGSTRTITWNAAFKWTGAAAPTLSTTTGYVDVFTWLYDGTSFLELTRSLHVA